MWWEQQAYKFTVCGPLSRAISNYDNQRSSNFQVRYRSGLGLDCTWPCFSCLKKSASFGFNRWYTIYHCFNEPGKLPNSLSAAPWFIRTAVQPILTTLGISYQLDVSLILGTVCRQQCKPSEKKVFKNNEEAQSLWHIVLSTPFVCVIKKSISSKPCKWVV